MDIHDYKIILFVYVNYIFCANKEYNNIPLKYLFE